MDGQPGVGQERPASLPRPSMGGDGAVNAGANSRRASAGLRVPGGGGSWGRGAAVVVGAAAAAAAVSCVVVARRPVVEALARRGWLGLRAVTAQCWYCPLYRLYVCMYACMHVCICVDICRHMLRICIHTCIHII